MLSKIADFIQPRHLGLVGLIALAWAYISLFRYDHFGIEEAAALDLLINWSIIHQIASPVALFGIPDLRAIFFIPLDMYWAGSLPAAKVYTMLTLFATALLLYRWGESQHGSESSMMATALLLISPLALMQTDAIGSGVYLLFCFVVAAWMHEQIQEARFLFNAWYFLLALITAMAVTMHPMGLALPLVLGWQWLSDPETRQKGSRLMIAIASVTVLMLFLRWGWYGIEPAASNPLTVLTDALLGSPLLHVSSWGIGLLIADIFVIVAGVALYRRTNDTLALIFIAASLIGIFNSDHAWALITWASTLYLGIPMLIQLNAKFGWQGLVGQRGFTMVVVMLVAIVSMINLRGVGTVSVLHLKNQSDQLIAVLEAEAADTNLAFVAASQWPARTLLACHRDVLPLPPSTEDDALFRKQTKGLTHFTFSPQDPALHDLSRNMAALTDKLDTIALMSGGVVLKTKHTDK